MLKIDNSEFISEIVNKGSRVADKEKADLIVTIQLYKNGFIVIFPPMNEKSEKPNFYSFSNETNINLFKQIKQNIFPEELLTKDRDYSQIKNLCVQIEDYSRENYFSIDNTSKITNIVIKLQNGKILHKEYNLFHTIKEIKESIEKDSNINIEKYSFIYGYPPIEIEKKEEEKTIEELELENSTLIQKIL